MLFFSFSNQKELDGYSQLIQLRHLVSKWIFRFSIN